MGIKVRRGKIELTFQKVFQSNSAVRMHVKTARGVVVNNKKEGISVYFIVPRLPVCEIVTC